MNGMVTIESTEMQIREYNGQRVVTFKDIDRVHKRPAKTTQKAFSRNGSLTLRLPLDFHNSLHHSPLRLIFLSNFKILLVIVCHCVV